MRKSEININGEIQGLYKIVGTPHSLVHFLNLVFIYNIYPSSVFCNRLTLNVLFALLIDLFSISVKFSSKYLGTMRNNSDFEKWQTVGMCMEGASIIKTAQIFEFQELVFRRP